MKRIICCLTSFVLAFGLVPMPAFAAADYAPRSANSLVPSYLHAQEATTEADPISATLPDRKLYAAVVEQLDAQEIAYDTDGTSTVTIAAEDNAKLTRLELANKRIKSTAGLFAFTALEHLDLSHNEVNDISGLAGLPHIVHLNLYDNLIHDFDGLASLASLQYLNLGENNEQARGALANLSALDGLTSLTYLDFSENYAPDVVDHLAALTDLEFLNLQQNNITSVAQLSNLTKLKTLVLAHNKIAGVGALAGMKDLEELNLKDNQLYQVVEGTDDSTDRSGINGLFDDSNSLMLKNLKKLDLWGNWQWTGGFMSGDGVGHMSTLFKMDQDKALELGYSYDRVKDYDSVIGSVASPRNTKLADLPHTDTAGTHYVTYDDFGAWRDGEHDDFNAMRNAHRFANAVGCEVRATAGPEYHIFRTYDLSYYTAYTNIDWQNATFVIHDENIDGLGARYAPILELRTSPAGATEATSSHKNIVKIANPTMNGALGKTTTSIAGLSPEVDSALESLREKGYDRFYVQVENAGKKHYIRFGSNANSGSAQWDGFIVDASGALESAIIGADGSVERPAQVVQWDFDAVTSVIVMPVPAEQSFVRNATFVSTTLDSKSEAPYGRSGGKPIYYLRNLQVRDCANVALSGIRQTVGTEEDGFDSNELTGSYNGFFRIMNSACIDMSDCAVWARRYDEGGRSTYGLSTSNNVNMTFTRFDCSNPWEQQLDVGGTRWGVMGTNHTKHVVFDHCTVNRIDAHEGFYDMAARDCKLGSWGFRLIGQGPLTIERCDVYSENFILLRSDYGSTWDGDARIIDCAHHYWGVWSQNLISFSSAYDSDETPHDFGYDLRYPNVYVKNLTVDEQYFDKERSAGKDVYYIVPNHKDNDTNRAERMDESYWPDKVEIDGINFVNYDESMGYEPKFCLVSSEEGTIAEKLSNYSATDVSYEGASEHSDIASGEQLSATSIELPFDITADDSKDNRFQVSSDDFSGKELAIEYEGTEPRIALMDANWRGWTSVRPYYTDRENRIAYVSEKTIRAKWADTRAAGKNDSDFDRMRVTTSGATTVKRVALVDAMRSHVHEWGEWMVVKEPTCTEAGVEQRVCKADPTHIEERAGQAALGHQDDGGKVTREATEDEEGEITHSCARCGVVLSREAMPKLSGSGKDDDPAGNGDKPSDSATGAWASSITDATLRTALADQLGVEDLASVDATKVLKLDLSNKYLKSIEGLESFTSLSSLDISNNNISDLSPLKSLTNLIELNAYGNRIADVTPVCGLTKLVHLELAKNELIDNASDKGNCHTSQLAALTNLEYLDLSHNLIRYTDGLGALANLEYLDLYDNAVHDFAGLADSAEHPDQPQRLTTSLKHLDLGENNESSKAVLTGLDNLASFANLEYLDFSENQTPDIVNHITGLKALKFLQLQKNDLTSLDGLQSLTNLETLILAKNNIADVRPLHDMKMLKELNLQNNDLSKGVNGLEGIFADKMSLDSIVWPHLRTLDISGNWQWNLRVYDETRLLYHLFQREGYQLGFRYDRIYHKAANDPYDSVYGAYPYSDEALEALMKTDESDASVRYVTYDDFGARHDGAFDDYNAMVNAHLFANDYQASHPDMKVEVRANPGASYHIFNYYNVDWYEIKTSVDWQKATIVIHDEEIENKASRFNPLFVVRSLDGGVATSKRLIMSNTQTSGVYSVVPAPTCTVDTSFKAGMKLPDELVSQFPEGYDRYVVEFFNEDKKQHIRSGQVNSNEGEGQYDAVIAHADGALEHDVQWDFDHLTKVTVLPIPAQAGHVRNANFVHAGIRSRSEVPYYRGGGKPIYFMRNIQTQYTANIDFSGLTHRLGDPDDWTKDWDEMSGSYFGLLSLQYIADVTVRDSSFYGRKFCDTARSTYDLPYTYVANCTFRNLSDKTGYSKDHRWSVISGHGGKNLVFDSCTTNSAGTHQTVYNMTVRNCELSTITLCGQGLFLAENTTTHSQYFASLRTDYGTTWNGEMRLVNCTHVYDGTNRPHLIDTAFDTVGDGSDRKLWDYGYTTRFPKLYVENLTVDYAANARDAGSWNEKNGIYYIVFNSEELYDPERASGALDYVPADYWPDDIVVNGVTFANGAVQEQRESKPVVRLTAAKTGHIADRERNYLMTNVHVVTGDSDVTERLFAGDEVSVAQPVKVSASALDGAVESFELVKLGASGGDDVVVKSLSPVEGDWETTVTDAGSYEVRLKSTSDAHGWIGARTLKFSVLPGADPSEEPGGEPGDSSKGDDSMSGGDSEGGSSGVPGDAAITDVEVIDHEPLMGTAKLSISNAACTLGSTPVDVISSGNTAVIVSAKSAKGAVRVDTVKTSEGRAFKVTSIAAGAFAGSKVTKVTLGSGVKSIGKGAFKGCKKLKSVVLGKNVKSVGANAFKGCKALKTVKVRSAKLTKASFKNLFAGSKVKTVKLVGMSKATKKKTLVRYANWTPTRVKLA